MCKTFIKRTLLIIAVLMATHSEAKGKYYWMSASQGRVTNITDSFAPFQLQVGHKSSGAITFKSKEINLSIKSKSSENSYPVNILFNPLTLCTINSVPVPSLEVHLEVNNIQYSRNSSILIEDDQFRQYRIILKLLGVSSTKRGSVLCDIKNALVIINEPV